MTNRMEHQNLWRHNVTKFSLLNKPSVTHCTYQPKYLINKKYMKFLTTWDSYAGPNMTSLHWDCQQTTCSVATVKTWQTMPSISGSDEWTCCLYRTLLHTSTAQHAVSTGASVEHEGTNSSSKSSHADWLLTVYTSALVRPDFSWKHLLCTPFG
jgi:hypothetical protein